MLPDGTRGKRARRQRRAIILAGRYIPYPNIARPFPTATKQTIHIKAESRTIAVLGEGRTINVPSESRALEQSAR
jgi:hypothetical protein